MTASYAHSTDLPLDTGSDAWVHEQTPPGLPAEFALILQNPQGAHLDVATIKLLTTSGVYNVRSFIQFTQEPFTDILCTLSDSHFSNLSHDKLCNAQLYGRYLIEQQLVQNDGTFDVTAFDWCAYYTYWH